MEEEEGWTCSVCTYNNRSEAFKCNICDTRKGTSTRKPRVTANIVAQQIASSFPLIPAEVVPAKLQKTGANSRRSTRNNSPVSVLAKNVDLDSRVDVQVTVGDHTVVISDYKLLKRKQTTKNNSNSEENNGETSLETSENSGIETANNGVETSVVSTSTSAKTQQQKHDDENKPAVSDDKTNNDVKMTSKNSDASDGTAAAVEE